MFVEHVERRQFDATIAIYVRQREKVASCRHLEVRLLHHLAHNTLLRRLTNLGEAARQVERALCRLLLSRQHEKLVLVIKDDSRRRGAWIEIILKAAILTLLALFVVVDKMLAATNRAVLELF